MTDGMPRPPAPATFDLWAQPGPFLVREVAAALRCSRRFVEKLVASGELPAARLGRQIRIPASAARRLAVEVGVEAPHANGANGTSAGEPCQVGARLYAAGGRKL